MKKETEEIFVCPKTGKVIKKKKLPSLIVWLSPVIGLFALLWFLLRVIPKPRRITYPCQQVAAPLAMSFLASIAGFFGIAVLIKKLRPLLKEWRHIIVGCLVLAIAFTSACALIRNDKPDDTTAASEEWIDDDDEVVVIVTPQPQPTDSAPGTPMLYNRTSETFGVGKGIFPGRVVWNHKPAATSWNGTSGFWWEDKNNDQDIINDMVSDSIRALTGNDTDPASWEALFKHFNKTRNGVDIGYKTGEKIAIKVNMNGVTNQGDRTNVCFISPHVLKSLLTQLVTHAGVAPGDITVFDASRAIPDVIYDKCSEGILKGIRFEDYGGGNGREASQPDTSIVIRWSVDVEGNPTYLPKSVTEAQYLINLTSIKGHDLSGITLTAKNHFGTIMSAGADGQLSKNPPQAANLHGYIAAHDYGGRDPLWTWPQSPMGTYNPLVDLIGHEHVGGKTFLYMIDGLYSSTKQHTRMSNDTKWLSAPFNNHWPSSIFVSQDPVAIDTVGFDFLANEPVIISQNNVLNDDSTSLNYLHEASQAGNPPSKTVYDPEGDGTKLESLGVYEHWNNPTDKKYSRNLGKDYGIELIIQ